VELLIKVLPAVFSYEDMKRRWNQDNPDEPYGRKDDLQNGIYAIENWLIRVDDEDNAIATGGWKEYPTHTVVGGLYAVKRADRNHPNHDPKLKGNARAIQDAREPQLNQSKPVIASFAQQRGDNARWIATAKKTQGFVFSDDPEWKQAISALPKEVVKEWTENSGNRWGIRNILSADKLAKCVYPDDPTPQWFILMKADYKRQLGKAGFNVIRTSDGKRMNNKGLSRSQAIQMIDDLNSGKDVSRYQNKKKTISSGWKAGLRRNSNE
jgi:hypothetical protein